MRDHEGMLEHGRMLCMIPWCWRFACGRLLDDARCMCLHDEIRDSYRFSHSQLESRYGPQRAWMRDLLRCLMSTWGIMRACLSMVGCCAWFHGSWRFACGRLLDDARCMCLHDEIRDSYRFSHSQLESRYGPQGAWMRDLLRCLMSTWGIMRACLSMVGCCAWFHGAGALHVAGC